MPATLSLTQNSITAIKHEVRTNTALTGRLRQTQPLAKPQYSHLTRQNILGTLSDVIHTTVYMETRENVSNN